MSKWVIVLVAVVAALAAPSSLAQVVLAQSVFRTANLPSNTLRTFPVTCAAGYLAVSAGVASPAPGATLLGIRPSGLAAYTFRFGNPVTNSGQQVKVVVACRRFFFKPPTRVKVTPLRLKVKVPAGKLTVAGLPCPPRTAPAGWGHDITSVQSRSAPGVGARVTVRKASIHLHGYSFSVRNSGAKAQSVTLYGTCLTALRQVGAPRERLLVRITTFYAQLQGASKRVVHNCPTGWVSLAAGYALRSPVTTIAGAAAIGRGGRWWIASDADRRTAADLQLVCARLSK